jgi:hypothetical protein
MQFESMGAGLHGKFGTGELYVSHHSVKVCRDTFTSSLWVMSDDTIINVSFLIGFCLPFAIMHNTRFSNRVSKPRHSVRHIA